MFKSILSKNNIWLTSSIGKVIFYGSLFAGISIATLVYGIYLGLHYYQNYLHSANVIIGIGIILFIGIVLSIWTVIKQIDDNISKSKTTFQISSNPQVIIDSHGVVLECNESFKQLTKDNNMHIKDRLDEIESDLLDESELKKINLMIKDLSNSSLINVSINLKNNKFINITANWFDEKHKRFLLLFQESFHEIKLTCAVGAIDSDTFVDTFDLSPSGLVVLDSDLKVVACNELFKTMTTESVHEKQQFLDLVEAEKSEEAIRKIKEIRDNGSGSSSINLFLKSGNNNHISGYVRSIQNGKLSLYFLNDADHKQLQIKLLQSQKLHAMGELAGGIAHDFNNLLTAMIGFCDLLLVRHSPADQSFTDIMQIKQNANRAANLVKQLLAFSRQQTLQPKVIDISEQLYDLTILLQRLVGSNIKIDIVHGSDIGFINADHGQLEQVIINLVVNARDAIGENSGNIVIRLDSKEFTKPFHHDTEIVSPGRYVKIQVIDDGEGIDPKIIGRIFDPFFSTKESGSGTGLGLSMVYGIIKQMGGFILVDTKASVGTTFSIYLPEYSQQITSHTNDNSNDISDKNNVDLSGSGTILFVEDEVAVRMFGSRTMRDNGYTVIEAENGKEALNIIDDMIDQGENIDLIVTDVVMPHMDGPTMAEKVKEKLSDVEIIFISGYAESTFRDKVSSSDSNSIHFLSKPFTLKDLSAKIKQVMNHGDKNRDADKVKAIANFRN